MARANLPAELHHRRFYQFGGTARSILPDIDSELAGCRPTQLPEMSIRLDRQEIRIRLENYPLLIRQVTVNYIQRVMHTFKRVIRHKYLLLWKNLLAPRGIARNR